MSRKRGPPKNFQDFVAEDGEEEYEETNTEVDPIASRMKSSRQRQSKLKKDHDKVANTTARNQSRFIVVSQFIYIFSFLYIYNAYLLHVTLHYRSMHSPELTAELRNVDSYARRQARYVVVSLLLNMYSMLCGCLCRFILCLFVC